MTDKVQERKTAHEVVTVILGNATPDDRKDLHCIACGRIVCNYYSETETIVCGEMREVTRPLDIMCSRCHLVYRIV